jgi:electron transfer flavoprotein beta subunit
MNPFCEIAVEEAIRMVEKAGEGEVVVVAIGDDEATTQVRAALAMGAHRGILVETSEDQLDSDLVAQILVKICQDESPDLVLLGKQAVDGDSNQVGQLVAEYLNWPQATFAYKIDLNGNQANVQREVDGGVETVALSLPAVITTDLRLNEPRYASLPNIMKAKKKPLDTTTPEDLGVDVSSAKVSVIGYALPQSRKAGQIVKSVEELVQKLNTEAKVL